MRPKTVMSAQDERPKALIESLHIFTLAAFAIAQPTFDLLGKHATFFVAHRSSPLDIVSLAIGLVVIPPATVLAVEWLAHLISSGIRRLVHLTAVGGFSGLIVVPPVVRWLDLRWPIAAALALIVGTGAAYAYRQRSEVRDLITYATPAPVLFLGLFLFVSPVHALLGSQSSPEVAALARSETPVVVLLFDELPLASIVTPDHLIDEVRFPGFARLAERSTWYRQAFTNSKTTQMAVPVALSGRIPEPNALPIVAEYPQNLFTILGSHYQMNVHEAVSRLCPASRCGDERPPRVVETLVKDTVIAFMHATLPADAAARFLPSIGERWANFANEPPAPPPGGPATSLDEAEFDERLRDDLDAEADEVYDRLVTAMKDGRGASLTYMHLMVPHIPWNRLPDGTVYPADEFGFDGRTGDWFDDQAYPDQALQRHLLQVQYADSFVVRLLEDLDEAGMFDDVLLVVFSDHGGTFSASNNRRAATGVRAGDSLRVPLFVKLPAQSDGRVDDRDAQLVDVTPTIADALGIADGLVFDGQSLLGEAVDGRPRPYVDIDTAGTVDDELDIGPMIRQIDDLFGPPGGVNDLYAWGPFARLVGKQLSSQDLGTPRNGAEVALVASESFDNYRPGTGFTPARVLASVKGVSPGTPVAVGLNGTIAGVGELLERDGDVIMSVMVSPRYLTKGANRIEIFSIEAGELRRLGGTASAPTWRVVSDGGSVGAIVNDASGRTYPVRTGAQFVGSLDAINEVPGGVRVAGWLVNLETRQIPDLVVIVQDRKVVAVAPVDVTRADVADALGDDAFIESGFSRFVPGGDQTVEAFAIFSDDAAAVG